MQPEDCSKFPTCSCNCCPLDADWHKRVHLASEPVCPYLLGSAKRGAAEHYQNDPVYAVCLAQRAAIIAKHPAIARAVERASKTGFRSDNLKRHGKASSDGAYGQVETTSESISVSEATARTPQPGEGLTP